MAKVKAIVTALENAFVIQKGDKRETVAGETALDQGASIKAIVGATKSHGTLQNAYCVFLHHVLNRPLCDAIKGKGDVTTGKVDKNGRAYIRSAEVAYINECHAAGIKGIPADEAARIALAESIRNDGNYSNIKNTVVKYFAFCGKLPMTSAGILVPKQVMQAEISAVLNIAPEDNSLYGQLLAIKRTLDEGTLDEDMSRKCEPLARDLAGVFKALCAHYDELATNKAQGLPANAGDTAKVASEVIGKAKRAPATVKDAEPAKM